VVASLLAPDSSPGEDIWDFAVDVAAIILEHLYFLDIACIHPGYCVYIQVTV
jgi:hypothetical protein